MPRYYVQFGNGQRSIFFYFFFIDDRVAYVSSAYKLDEPVSIGLRQTHQYSKHALTLGRSELVNPHMSPSLAHMGPR